MKQKFFRIEWENEDNMDLDAKDIHDALIDKFWIDMLDVHQISDKVFKEDTCSITKNHNYQPPICVNCGKEKPKKVEKLTYRDGDTYDYQITLIDKINELVGVVNRG